MAKGKNSANEERDRVMLPEVTTQDVEARMIMLRGLPVLIDADVAELYGVQTKEVNQAVKNNPRKFPDGYIIELVKQEKEEVVKNFDRLKKLKFSKIWPVRSLNRLLIWR